VACSDIGGGFVDNFIGSITTNLELYPKAAETLLKIDGITPSMSKDEAVFAILNFSTEIGMVAPTIIYAKGWLGEAFCTSSTSRIPGKVVSKATVRTSLMWSSSFKPILNT
jgi:hypothetical protein